MAVVLAVTSLSAAYARGQATAAGSMVICQGLTVVTVLVDQDGNPVDPPHICPDAALALFVENGVQPPEPVPVIVWHPVQWRVPIMSLAAQAAPDAQARGPPRFS